MRITSFAIFNQMTRSLQEGMKKMSLYSERLSSGKKINKPSDDVYGMMNAMGYKVTLNEIDQYKKNIDNAESQLGLTETVMSSVGDILSRARELAVQGSTGTQTPANRASIAQEIASLRDEAIRLSQTQLRERYIFSGYKTDMAPFDASFNYQGDTNEINVLIDRNSTIALNVTGDEAFSSGGETYFETLDNLYNALMDPTSGSSTIAAYITSIDNATGQVANVRADVGARMNYIERVKSTHEDRDTELKAMLSNTEDDDIAGTISELTKIQVSLESLRASGAKILSQSLMDFLD
jgi:flagellar hook-associated protein 3 FlgL